MSENPRRLLGLEPPEIAVGKKAELIIVDTEKEWLVEPEKLHSKSKNTVFKGMTLKGKVMMTINDGKIYDLKD
jgi:dihydroorotase